MTYASEVLADSPLGYWELDGSDATTSAADSSGNGFNGSWVGTPAYASRDFGAPGLNDVADFNGAYLTIADATGLGDSVGDATIEAWVQFDSLTGSRLIFTHDNTSSSSRPNFYFWWKGSTSQIMVGWRSGSTYYDHAFSWSPSTATTYHLVATADGTNVRFYANGSLVGTVAQSSAPTAGVGTQYVIGADYGGTSAFSGAIGYVAFYGTALSSARVRLHYLAGTGVTPSAYEEAVLADDPVRYWKLDETSGTTAADSSGSGSDGTIAGSGSSFGAGGPIGSDGCWTGAGAGYISNGTPIITTTDFTIELWAKLGTSAATESLFFEASTGASNVYVGLNVPTTGKARMNLRNGTDVSVNGATTVNDNQWHHIVMAVTGSATSGTCTGTLYVDGVSDASGTLGARGTYNNSSTGLLRRNSNTDFLNGSVAQVAVYQTALSSTRVAAHYSAATSSAVAKADTETFTLSESEAVTTRTALADTDTATATDSATKTTITSKSSTDSFMAGETQSGALDSHPVASDLFTATELEFKNYAPSPPLDISFSGHRVYAQIAEADDLPVVPRPSRTFRIPTVGPDTDQDLDLYLLDENQDIIDVQSFSLMTLDIATPGTRVEGIGGDITAEPAGNGDPIVWVTIPGGLPPGVYSLRVTVNTGTVESPVYRSYPTEPITLIVEE